MPARAPEEWLKLFFEHTGVLPLPAGKTSKIIAQCADDIRKEALIEAHEVCLQHFKDDGSAQKCANDIKEMIEKTING